MVRGCSRRSACLFSPEGADLKMVHATGVRIWSGPLKGFEKVEYVSAIGRLLLEEAMASGRRRGPRAVEEESRTEKGATRRQPAANQEMKESRPSARGKEEAKPKGRRKGRRELL